MKRKCCGKAACPGNPAFGNTKCKCGHWWYKDGVVGGCPMCNDQGMPSPWKLANVRADGAHVYTIVIQAGVSALRSTL